MMRILKNIWLILSLDCEQSAQLTSDSFDRKLTWAEHVAVFMHRFICRKSRRLNRQMVILNRQLKALADDHWSMKATLSDNAKHRIRNRLKDMNGS